MKVGHIYINGQIGSSESPSGEVIQGVELQHIILQANANKDSDQLNVHITSHGGNVLKGRAIASYISSLPNAFTIAEGHCSSIATEVHLAVPFERRKIVEGTKYFIHAPLINGFTGNADKLNEMADLVRDFEKEMQAMYCKATGLDKEAIAGLMKQETSLTDEQCLALRFASEILPATQMKAVAFLEIPNKINTYEQMEKSLLEKISALFSGAKKDLNIKAEDEAGLNEVVAAAAIDIETDNGVLHIETPATEGVATVGDVVTIDGASAPEGEYKTSDESVITIDADGKVVSVVAKEVEAIDEMQALKDENAALKAEIATAKEEMMTEVTALVEKEIVALKRSITSNYTPPTEKKNFNKGAKTGELEVNDIKEKMKEAKNKHK